MLGTEFLKGQGLGNQLFCYVTARCIAEDNGYEFGTAGQQQFANNIHSQSGMYFMDIDLGNKIHDISTYTRYDEKDSRIYMPNSRHDIQHGCYVAGADEAMLHVADNTLLYGNMQSEKYFGHHKDDIKKWLRVRDEFNTYEYTRDNLCIMNMRGGEYTGSPELYLEKAYWVHAMEKMRSIRSDMQFMIVTEDIAQANKMFPDIPAYHFDMGRDYVVVKNATYLIVSNSSFAFFPAYTSDTLRYCIAPKYWARHNVSDGYWASEQNIYSCFEYMDRKGNLYTAEECKQELEEYKKKSVKYKRINIKYDVAKQEHLLRRMELIQKIKNKIVRLKMKITHNGNMCKVSARRCKINLKGSNNSLFSLSKLVNCNILLKGHESKIQINEGCMIENCDIVVAGKSSVLKISKNAYIKNVKISLYGDECQVIIGQNFSLGNNSEIVVSNNSKMIFGKNISIGNNFYANASEGEDVIIDDNCLFSKDITIRNSDSHVINQKGVRINPAKRVSIAEHVWLGDGVMVLKGCKIQKDVIIGARSILTNNEYCESSIYAGAPPKKIKSDVEWER